MDTAKIGECNTCGSRYMQMKMILQEVSSDTLHPMFRIECAKCGQLIAMIASQNHSVVHLQHFPNGNDYETFHGYFAHYDAIMLKKIRKSLKTITFYRIRYFFHIIKEIIKDAFINIAKKNDDENE